MDLKEDYTGVESFPRVGYFKFDGPVFIWPKCPFSWAIDDLQPLVTQTGSLIRTGPSFWLDA